MFGVVVALTVMRDPIFVRLATALMWPLGPLALVVVVALLLAASMVLWPLPAVAVAALVAALAWWLA